MQQLIKYGVRLSRLEPNEIEQVRLWRNSRAVATQMEYTGNIGVAAQQQWFNQVSNSNTDYYFMIYIRDTPIGLIHLNQVNLNRREAHAGLFIGDPHFIGTGVVLGASLLLLQFAFDELMLDIIYAKVKKVNEVAIAYNRYLGFEWAFMHNNEFDMFALSRVRFQQKRIILEKLASSASFSEGGS